MIRRPGLLLLACALALLRGGEAPAWDWLPHAVDDDLPTEFLLAADPRWQAEAQAGLTAERRDAVLALRLVPRLCRTAAVAGPGGARIAVALAAPGEGSALRTDAEGRLRQGEDFAVLSVPRREAAADRRWGLLRGLGATATRTDVELALPAAATGPAATLLALVAAAQALDPRGRSVLVALPGEDRLAGWKHREYRQVLAWLVADLAARAATRIVLVEPCCPKVDEPLMQPLRAQARDVAAAFRCGIVDTTALGEHRLWQTAGGIIGPRLNADGEAERRRLLAGWAPVR